MPKAEVNVGWGATSAGGLAQPSHLTFEAQNPASISICWVTLTLYLTYNSPKPTQY